MKKLILVAAVLAGIWAWPESAVEHGPGVVAPDAPLQQPPELAEFRMGRYELTPVARFELEARVLALKTYRLDTESELSPIDLALGWGRMSDESVLEHLEISQSGRFYRWRTEAFPIPRKEIETHSANMHLIPADADVAADLGRLRKGQVLRIQGHLVNVRRDDGWQWRSSTKRTDTGYGACELIYVQRILTL